MTINTAFKDKIYAWEGVIFNALCAFYFVLIAPVVQEISIHNIKDENSFFPWLGIALLIISLLELYAFPKKMNYVHKAVLDHNGEMGSGMILWMFHTVISIIVLFSMLEAFGIEITTEDGPNRDPHWLALLMPIVVVIKELYLLMFIMGRDDNNKELVKYKRPNKKEWQLDLILLAYTCLVYTVTWNTITNNMVMEEHNLPMYIINIIIASILFLVFYMPLRIPYFIEEMALLKTDKDVFKFIASILLVLISAIASL